MLLMPDPASAILDPFTEAPTLSLICEIADPFTREQYDRDPRGVAKRAEAYLNETGIADTAHMGPECEFFVFDEVSYDLGPNHSHYAFDSAEGHWNSGKPGLGYTIREKEGYFPPAPHDTLHDLRSAMVLTLERLGIPCEFHHHEVASGGQCEIDLRYQTLTRMADQVMTYKYVVKNVARAAGKTVTFMPKPLFGDNGSGMHTHQSLWKEGTPLMADKSGYAGLSQLARAYVGGLLTHAPALLAFCAPTTNSYRRLVPGYEAPVNLVYSQRNRSACIRIPMYSDSPKAKRIEFRCPDAAANPYLAFAAMLMAGHRRHPEGPRPGRARRLRPLRGGRTRRRPGAGLARRGARRARARPRVPDRRRRLLGGADPDLDRVEAGERGRPGRAPAAPGRVRPLLRLRRPLEIRELRAGGLAGGACDLRAGHRRPERDLRDRGSLVGGMGRAAARRPSAGGRRGRRRSWAGPRRTGVRCGPATAASSSTASTSTTSGRDEAIGRALLEAALRRAPSGTGSGRSRPGVFPENEASLGLACEAAASGSSARGSGSGSWHGVWRDVVLLERRSEVIT